MLWIIYAKIYLNWHNSKFKGNVLIFIPPCEVPELYLFWRVWFFFTERSLFMIQTKMSILCLFCRCIIILLWFHQFYFESILKHCKNCFNKPTHEVWFCNEKYTNWIHAKNQILKNWKKTTRTIWHTSMLTIFYNEKWEMLVTYFIYSF